MKRIIFYRLLAVAMVAGPGVSRAQGQDAQAPRATIRELATIDAYLDGFVRLPGSRTLIYTADDSTFAYDIASKRRTLLGSDMIPSSVSPGGDRLAFGRSAEGQIGTRLWTMPIDPRTGIATGPAQLVSQRRIETSGIRARFSPDGRMLALFGQSAKPPVTWDLIVVPVTGGPEKVLATYPGALRLAWSGDGGAVDVEVYANGTAIERVPVDGSPRRALFPVSPATSTMGVGVSSDDNVAIYTMNPDRFFYRTASGMEGEIVVPLPAIDDGWGYDFSLDRDNKYLSVTGILRYRGVRILDVETGRTRVILPGETSNNPTWSPDGRRLAVLTGTLSHPDIAIMNADGSGLRRFTVPMLLVWPSGVGIDRPWSPDGRYFAFFAEVGSRVGYTPGNQRQLVILDVTSGATRALASTPGHFSALEWRADSRSIRVIRNHSASPLARAARSIVDIALDGTERLLRDVSAEFPNHTGVGLSPNDVAVVAIRVGNTVDRFLVPLGGGAARKLPDPGMEAGITSLAVGSVGPGNRMWLPIGDGNGAFPTIRIISTAGDSTRTVRAPFGSINGQVVPDGKQLLLTGRAAGDSVHKLYYVSLESGAQRLLGDIPGGGNGRRLAPSPDGKLIAFTTNGRQTTTVREIDFGPVIRAVQKR